MKKIYENETSIEIMKSGHLCLTLCEDLSWDLFPDYASWISDVLNAPIGRKIDSFDLRIWEICYLNFIFRVVYDDFPVSLSIESTSFEGDSLIDAIKKNYAVNKLLSEPPILPTAITVSTTPTKASPPWVAATSMWAECNWS